MTQNFSARAEPLEAGAVVTLRETTVLELLARLRGMFRSSLLRSPAGAYRRSQSCSSARADRGRSQSYFLCSRQARG
jgi:hypothetical protein